MQFSTILSLAASIVGASALAFPPFTTFTLTANGDHNLGGFKYDSSAPSISPLYQTVTIAPREGATIHDFQFYFEGNATSGILHNRQDPDLVAFLDPGSGGAQGGDGPFPVKVGKESEICELRGVMYKNWALSAAGHLTYGTLPENSWTACQTSEDPQGAKSLFLGVNPGPSKPVCASVGSYFTATSEYSSQH